MLHEQQRFVAYNDLVASPVVLPSVEQMSRVLSELWEEDIEISQDVLDGLSPYRTSYIDCFSDDAVDTSRALKANDFPRGILSKANEAKSDTHQGDALKQ